MEDTPSVIRVGVNMEDTPSLIRVGVNSGRHSLFN